MKLFIGLCVLSFSSTVAMGQYLENPYAIPSFSNPAYTAGNSGPEFSASALNTWPRWGRSLRDWPLINEAAFAAEIGSNKLKSAFGLGFVTLNDGFFTSIPSHNIRINYAYQFKLGESLILRTGLRAGIHIAEFPYAADGQNFEYGGGILFSGNRFDVAASLENRTAYRGWWPDGTVVTDIERLRINASYTFGSEKANLSPMFRMTIGGGYNPDLSVGILGHIKWLFAGIDYNSEDRISNTLGISHKRATAGIWASIYTSELSNEPLGYSMVQVFFRYRFGSDNNPALKPIHNPLLNPIAN